MLATADLVDLGDDLIPRGLIQPGRQQGALEQGAGVLQLQVLTVVVDVADVGQGEDRLAAVALDAGHGGDGSRGGDGRLGGVADAVALQVGRQPLPVQRRAAVVVFAGHQRARRFPAEVVRVVDAARDGQERAAVVGQIDAGAHGVVAHELHDRPGQRLPLRAAVAHADAVEQVAQAHDAQADAPGVQRRLAQLGHGRHVGVGRHHVVEEAGGLCGRAAQLFPVDAALGRYVAAEVDRAEAAVLVGAEPLLAAGVGRLQLVEMGHGVAAVGRVQEEDARLAVAVGVLDDLIEDVAGAHRAPHLAVARVHQVEVGVVLHGADEGVGDADGDVEVGDGVFAGLAGDELEDVGVVDAQHGHVGPAPRAPLGDLAEGLVIDAQEADRAGGLAGRGVNVVPLGPQAREGEAVAAARLLDERRVAQGLEDAGRVAAHVVDDGQDEAGGQLAQRRARAGEGRAVGEEAQLGQQAVEGVLGRGHVAAVVGFDQSDVVCHAPEHLLDRLGRLAVGAAPQIATAQDGQAVLRQG